MQSTTTKRTVVIAGCANLGMNEEQPTQGGEFSCATKPAICIPPSVSACYWRSHRRPSRDLPAESMCSDVEHVPVAVGSRAGYVGGEIRYGASPRVHRDRSREIQSGDSRRIPATFPRPVHEIGGSISPVARSRGQSGSAT